MERSKRKLHGRIYAVLVSMHVVREMIIANSGLLLSRRWTQLPDRAPGAQWLACIAYFPAV